MPRKKEALKTSPFVMSQPRLQNPTEAPARALDTIGIGVLLYAYAVLLGASYLFAFWRPFGFDVFPYVAAQDYLSAPLNRMSVLLAPPLVLAVIVFGARRVSERSLAQISIYLTTLYALGFAYEFYRAASRYRAFDFHFPNESNVLFVAGLFFMAGVAVAYYAFRFSVAVHAQIAGLILVQSSLSMAAGYSDGKGVYTGAAQVHFLENKELCESGGLRDWVYLGTFGERTFFMNTIDKRLCLTAEKNIRLVSRMVKEKL